MMIEKLKQPIWRFFHPMKCRARYRVEYTGDIRERLRNQGRPTCSYVAHDNENDDEIIYMFKVMLGSHHHYRIFIEYHDGTEQEIKLSRYRKTRRSTDE